MIKAFVNDLSRNCYFNYDHTDDSYPHIETYIFKIQPELMMNKTGYAPNENYDVRITGTTNMTTSLKAFSFAAKGHYYQLDEDVFNSDSRPKITDINGTEIKQNEEDDETYLGVERYSGVCLIAMERIFLNMVIYRDALFNTDNIPEDNGWFFPVTFIKRESKWSLKQVNDTFGPLVMGLS